MTLILGAGRSSKSRRLGLRIRLAGSGLRYTGTGFLGVVNVDVGPEKGTPTTEGLRAIPGTGVKALNGGLCNLSSSCLCLPGIGGVGGGALNGTGMVRTCLRDGNALGAWGTWDTSMP